MTEFMVGDTVDEAALSAYASLLRTAYENGAANNATMDWSDIDAAKAKAVEAFGEQGRVWAAAAAAEDGFQEEIAITFPADASWEVRSAATLLYAYRDNDTLQWEDVDLARELLLQADVERGMKPA